MGSIKERLIEALDTLPRNGVLKTSRTDNAGALLGQIFVWQETRKYAEQQLKGAWQAAVAAELIPEDNALRDSRDEATLGESKNFTIVIKVDAPRQVFSRDKFINAIAKRYKLDPGKLNAIAAECTDQTAAPLSKRVVERGEV